MMTKKTGDAKINDQNTIGAVGGMDIPVIRNFVAGYEAGAKYVDPTIKLKLAMWEALRIRRKAKKWR